MAYATYEDIEERYRDLDADEQARCTALLDDAAVMIDAFAAENVEDSVTTLVSCNMVIRALGSGGTSIPVGATQATQTGLGYTQSYTFGSGMSGELYFSKTDRKLLKIGNRIGTRSPVEDLAEVEANA